MDRLLLLTQAHTCTVHPNSNKMVQLSVNGERVSVAPDVPLSTRLIEYLRTHTRHRVRGGRGASSNNHYSCHAALRTGYMAASHALS